MKDPFESETIIIGKPPTEVLSNGNPVESQSGKNLADIFLKVDAGYSVADAIEQQGNAPEPDKEQSSNDDKLEAKQSDSKLDAKLAESEGKQPKPQVNDEDVSREKLLEATSPKKEETNSATDKASEVKPEPVDPEAPSDDDLKVLPHDKPKTAKRIQALLKKVEGLNMTFTETKRLSDEKVKRVTELEEQLKNVQSADPATSEAVKTQLDELRMFKRKYELDSDPELKTRFDSRVEYAEKGITEILAARQASPALLKLISNEGGWTKFSSSTSPVSVRGADGNSTTITATEAAENILSALPMVDRKRLESAMMEQIQIERDKKRFIEDETKRANEFFSEREEQSKKQTEVQKKSIEDAGRLIEEFKTTAIAQRDWLKQEDIPASATQDQKSEIEDSNAYKKQLAALLKKNLEVRDVPSMLGVVEDSVAYYAERRKTARLTDEVSRLKNEVESSRKALDKFKSASKTTVRSGSISGGSSSSSVPNRSKIPASLTEAFDAIEAGEKLGTFE